MRAFEHIIVGGQHQPGLQCGIRLAFKQVIHRSNALYVCDLIVILAVLLLPLQVHVAVGALLVPAQLLEVPHALQGHGNALQPISYLYRHGIQSHAARLLEVRKLGDLLPIQPYFPSQAPRAQRR